MSLETSNKQVRMDKTYIPRPALTHQSPDDAAAASRPRQLPIQPISASSHGSTISSATSNGLISTIPHEILTQILKYILVNDSEKPITLHSRSGRRWKNEVFGLKTVHRYDARQKRYFAIPKVTKSDLLDTLLVCRNFYFAGIAAFFGENVLKFNSAQHLDQLTATLDLDRRRCIRHIVLHWAVRARPRFWDIDVAAVGGQLSVCFERLPSLLSARLVCEPDYNLTYKATGSHMDKAHEVFENLKTLSGEKGEEVLKLEFPGREELELYLLDSDL